MSGFGLTRFGYSLTSQVPSIPVRGQSSARTQPKRTNQDLFASNLEARFSNARSGAYTYTDKQFDNEIASRDGSINQSLSSSDPNTLRSYSGYLSGLGYNNSARLVSNVEYSIRKLSSIPSKEESEAQTKLIVDAYKKKG